MAVLVDSTDVIDQGRVRIAWRARPCIGNAARKAWLLTMEDPYAVLGVPRTATQAEITHAYRRHLRDYHPDRRAGDCNSGADERLRQILAAYALLRDARRRAAYDRAHPVRTKTVPVRIPVRRRRFGRGDRPPLWVGPVRWER